jgi:hypothetical protein
MSRPAREAKRRAIEIIIGSVSEDEDEVLQHELEEVESDSEMELQANEEDSALNEMIDVEEDIVYWQENEESEASDDENPELPIFPQPIELGRDGTSWTKGLPNNFIGRQPRQNIFHGVPGVIKRGINPNSAKEAFLIFADNIIDQSILFTNLHGRRMTEKANREKKESNVWKKTNREEMEAFYGLLLLAGAFKAQYRSTEELWSEKEGQAVFRATMSRNRFATLKGNLRFDDPLRRDRNDPIAPVRDVMTSFISSLRQYVTAPEYLCIDEQLLEYHGRVRFRQYIPSKPGKFGIKIFWLTDSTGKYCFNGLTYIGKGTLSEKQRSESSSLAEAIVMNLMDPFLNNGRHLTADNWFSSVKLVERLLENGTTYVGTIRKNQRALPPSLKDMAGRNHGDVQFAHNQSMLLVSFWDKGTSPVLIIDSLHRGHEMVGEKPSSITFYNETKSGVDTLDKKIRAYSCKRKCRRWPFGFICNFLDISCINAMYLMNKSSDDKKYHYSFIKNVGYQLVDSHIRRRLVNTKGLKNSVITAMKMIGYKVEPQPECHATHLEKARRCQLCPYSKDLKTKSACCKCSRAMCSTHRAFLCTECALLP